MDTEKFVGGWLHCHKSRLEVFLSYKSSGLFLELAIKKYHKNCAQPYGINFLYVILRKCLFCIWSYLGE
jgi:hypothetical protein